MKKRILFLALIFVFSIRQVAVADEGMWLVHLLGEQVYNEMVKKGLKLTKEQLYSLNKASIKDAIIIFGGGCTGEIVSPQGLIFTNHHCGYDAIARASSVEHNYLRDGFFAKSRSEEIRTELSVQFLVRIEDVTAQVEAAVAGLSDVDRAGKLPEVYKQITDKAIAGTGYEGRISGVFKGNQFLLFIYERYRDIRFVGTPPESIGKFGGDTDNWEWPRHTGDFSVFRVYANKDNKPAEYSADNVPFKPKHYLPVSIKGFKDGDYAMIFGYPGSTNRYETSFGVKLKTDITNMALVRLRDMRLKFMMAEMEKDPGVRLKMASSYASIANYWKFFDGEAKQLLKYDVYGQKKKQEEQFTTWAKGKPEFQSIFANYEAAYKEWTPYAKARVYMNEGVMGSPLLAFARSLQTLENELKKTTVQKESNANGNALGYEKALTEATSARAEFLKSENIPSDQNIVAGVTEMFHKDIDPSQQPTELYQKIEKQYGDLNSSLTYVKMSEDLFNKTMILDDKKWDAFVAKPSAAALHDDPAVTLFNEYYKKYMEVIDPKFRAFTVANNDLGRYYLKGVRAMNPAKVMYPDATFTMRASYGSVKSYVPRDAVKYDYVCTLTGVMQKYQPGNYEFDLPKSLIDAYKSRNFGQYEDPIVKDIVVNFITTNDITGGNSGSPVMNGNGELIGLAFDGNYEALSHQIAFDKDLNRTICVDVRYVLWCIDVLGGAKNIINELTIK